MEESNNKNNNHAEETSKKIVVPGEFLGQTGKKRIGSHVFIKDNGMYSDVLGLLSEADDWINIIPLEGKYDARRDDVVIGVVASERFAGYDININGFYPSFIPKSALRNPLRLGDIVSGIVDSVNEVNEISLTNIRTFFDGEIIHVSPVKVPRMIGKNNSMLNVLKQGTLCQFVIGRNGMVWAKGGNIDLLVKALRKIEHESHLSNLTNNINEFLEEEKKKGELK